MANCKCGGKLVTNDPKKMKYLKCKECEAIAYKDSFGVTFTNKEMKELLEGKELYKELKSKSGKLYSTWVYIDFEDTKKLKTNFEKELPSIFKCQCGGDVFDKGKLYVCKECDCKLMKEISKVTITRKNAEKIFAGESVFIEDFISKENKPFDANIEFKGPGSWAEFVFDQDVDESDLQEEKGFLADKKEIDDVFDDLEDEEENEDFKLGSIPNDEDDDDYNDIGFLTGEN